jgi:hypothetical protein
MQAGNPGPGRDVRRKTLPAELLEFRPWMLALAVFLACAIGIAIMERSHDDAMWAQAQVADGSAQR